MLLSVLILAAGRPMIDPRNATIEWNPCDSRSCQDFIREYDFLSSYFGRRYGHQYRRIHFSMFFRFGSNMLLSNEILAAGRPMMHPKSATIEWNPCNSRSRQDFIREWDVLVSQFESRYAS